MGWCLPKGYGGQKRYMRETVSGLYTSTRTQLLSNEKRSKRSSAANKEAESSKSSPRHGRKTPDQDCQGRLPLQRLQQLVQSRWNRRSALSIHFKPGDG